MKRCVLILAMLLLVPVASGLDITVDGKPAPEALVLAAGDTLRFGIDAEDDIYIRQVSFSSSNPLLDAALRNFVPTEAILVPGSLLDIEEEVQIPAEIPPLEADIVAQVDYLDADLRRHRFTKELSFAVENPDVPLLQNLLGILPDDVQLFAFGKAVPPQPHRDPEVLEVLEIPAAALFRGTVDPSVLQDFMQGNLFVREDEQEQQESLLAEGVHFTQHVRRYSVSAGEERIPVTKATFTLRSERPILGTLHVEGIPDAVPFGPATQRNDSLVWDVRAPPGHEQQFVFVVPGHLGIEDMRLIFLPEKPSLLGKVVALFA